MLGGYELGLIAMFYFMLYSVFAYIVIGFLGTIVFNLMKLKTRPKVKSTILLCFHYFGFYLFLLAQGSEMRNYDGSSLIGPFLLVGFVIFGLPTFGIYWMISKGWYKKNRKNSVDLK